MEKGFIFDISSQLIKALKYLNLVEVFKLIGKKLATSEAHQDKYTCIAIDIFVVFKWLIIAWLWFADLGIVFELPVACYFIFFNLFTYFYHHTWCPKTALDLRGSRRRYISFIQALSYNVYVFAYIYADLLYQEYTWDKGTFNSSPIIFSLATSLTLSSSSASPISLLGESMAIAQTTISFIFLSLILSNTSIKGDQ